ncbi:MAG: hypothetical protein JSW28_02000 [Thermoplasmata archaeon]|nr:MAG: hypothetical protein JSW28_02000 [Thermoplasmata archaeon]
MAHFFWGYSIALPLFLLILWLVTRDVKVSTLREFFVKRGSVGIFGGIWAMIPDLDHFLGEPVFENAPWTNIFFFHRYCDIELGLSETDLFFAAELMLAFAVVNLFALAYTVESFKRLNEALFGREEEEEEEEEEVGEEEDLEDDGETGAEEDEAGVDEAEEAEPEGTEEKEEAEGEES